MTAEIQDKTLWSVVTNARKIASHIAYNDRCFEKPGCDVRRECLITNVLMIISTTVILLLEHCWVFLMHLLLLITKMTSKLFHHIPFLRNRHFEFLSPIFNNDRLLIL